MQRFKRNGFAVGLVTIWFASCLAAHAMASGVNFEIPAGSAATTLKEFAAQAHVQLLFDYKVVKALKTPAISGQLEPTEALKTLLQGSGLTFRQVNDHTIAVMALGSQPTTSNAIPPGQSPTETGNQEGKKSSSGGFLLAQATPGQTSSSGPSVVAQQKSAEATRTEGILEEVLVTAQKREERLQDVPVPISVISGTRLAESNSVRLQDYFSSIPAFSVSPAGFPGGTQMLTIRGLSSGAFTNPTVGVAVDDVPFGNSSGNFGGNVVPDFDPSDLARVEVLRGPQGTLYGADSMGGLIKFVTVDPSTTAFAGRVQADVNTVQNGAEAGLGFRGAVNIPLGDTFAVRASGFARQDPGYIDDPVLGINGVNEAHVYGGRISGLWRPNDAFSFKLSALIQDTKADGINEVDLEPGLGDLQQAYIRDCCGYNKKLQVYSAIANIKAGDVAITSVTGFNVNHFTTGLDYSYLLGPFSELLYGVNGAGSYSNGNTDKFTQEIRASIPLGSKVDWLIGSFYTHENISYINNIYAQDIQTGAIGGVINLGNGPIKNTEYAGFTDLTVHITDTFNLQLGARESRIEQIAEPVVFVGPLYNGGTVFPRTTDNANSFTYLVTPQWKVSPDLMVYARIASGYRPAALNNFNPDPLTPAAATPDKTQNYEIGVKGDALNHALTFDASVYYIDWKNIQIALQDPRTSIAYTANGSRAKSEGVELSVGAKPLEGLAIAAWVAFDDAVLTEDMPADSSVFGPSGSRLPFGSRFSGNLSVDQKFPLGQGLSGSVGGELSYVGNRLGTFIPFSTTTERAYYPAYTKLDLHIGLAYESWDANLYANNVTNKRGLLGGGAGTYPPFAYYFIQPRSIGLSIVKTF